MGNTCPVVQMANKVFYATRKRGLRHHWRDKFQYCKKAHKQHLHITESEVHQLTSPLRTIAYMTLRMEDPIAKMINPLNSPKCSTLQLQHSITFSIHRNLPIVSKTKILTRFQIWSNSTAENATQNSQIRCLCLNLAEVNEFNCPSAKTRHVMLEVSLPPCICTTLNPDVSVFVLGTSHSQPVGNFVACAIFQAPNQFAMSLRESVITNPLWPCSASWSKNEQIPNFGQS